MGAVPGHGGRGLQSVNKEGALPGHGPASWTTLLDPSSKGGAE